MEITATEFWSLINYELLTEITGVCTGSFFIGYAMGLKFYAFRRFLNSSIR